MGIEKMLRMYLLQIWFNLSDPATEDAIYDSYAMRKFTGIDFMTEAVPDETTLVTPMVRRSRSRMDGPNWTQRRRNRGVIICRSVGRSFLRLHIRLHVQPSQLNNLGQDLVDGEGVEAVQPLLRGVWNTGVGVLCHDIGNVLEHLQREGIQISP